MIKGEDKKSGAASISIDFNKTAEQYIKEAENFYIVPMLIRDNFPDLIKLIVETESMDMEEREYWLQIMPIMSEDQIVKFRNILVNEKEQLNKLDTEYESEMSRIKSKNRTTLDEGKLKERISQIKEAEKVSDVAEISQEEDLLKQLEGL